MYWRMEKIPWKALLSFWCEIQPAFMMFKFSMFWRRCPTVTALCQIRLLILTVRLTGVANMDRGLAF